MITLTKRQLAVLVLAAIVGGWWMSLPAGSTPSPFGPPANDRPVLRTIARLAKNFLWIALLAEGPPAEPEAAQYVRAHVGEDGYQTLDHGRGW
jgi:hypothetical protein